MKPRILALSCALVLTAACSSRTPTESAELPSVPIPDGPDGDDLAIPPKP